MTDLRARLAEVLAHGVGSPAMWELLTDPALGRALEDAERYAWLRKRIAPREVTEGYARMSAANADPDISAGTDAAIDAARLQGNQTIPTDRRTK